jgi:hypothetical protein
MELLITLPTMVMPMKRMQMIGVVVTRQRFSNGRIKHGLV